MARIRELFDVKLKFHKDDIKGAEQAVFDDSAWCVLDLPRDWRIQGLFDGNNISGQLLAYLPGGIGWYRKSPIHS